MCLIRITEDVFDVCDRLKSVDERYKLFYNAKKRRSSRSTSIVKALRP